MRMAVTVVNTELILREHKPIKKRRFIKDALLLMVITLVMRAVSTGFSIYISNLIGAEGIGLYQLTFSVYFLFITLATAGISLAVTRIVSEQAAVHNTIAMKSVFWRCMLLCIILSITASVILFFSADFIAITLLKDERTIIPLKLLTIGLPFLSIASTIRGFFLGLKKGIKAVSTDIAEQIVQIIITIPLLFWLLPKGLEAICCGLIIGSVIAEILSGLFSIVLYFREKIPKQGKKIKGLNRQIFSIIIPVAVSNYIRSALTTLENILVPSGLKKFGQNSSDALSQYGMIKGMALPLLYFPTAILSAFASLLIPEVSAANAIRAQKRIDYIIKKSLQVTLLFAFLITGIFISYHQEIGMTFYQSEKVGTMLLMLAPLVPLMYLDQIVDSILKGLNQQMSSMKYNTVDAALRTTIIFLLVPIFGMKGYVIMLYAGTIFNAALSINRLIVVGKVKFQLLRWVILPCTATAIACVFTRLLLQAGIGASLFMVCICYLFLLMLFGCISKRDIAWVIRIFYCK